uniref:Golgin candidate 6 n=1 Tax=Microbiota decussata TaxID=13614 RepID=A0A3Q8CHQ4_9CONI|nr:golgin candidate 6 [Microbiota decussata]
MAFKIGPINLNAIAQGVGGLAFGSGDHGSEEDDSGVERLLDRISNGVLADDRRAAVAELQAVVAESGSAQLAFGAMGFPVLMSVLKEERDDVEMVRGALETLVNALTPIENTPGVYNEVQPASLNSELLSREAESISLLLSLLTEDDFYMRYYTLQLLTALITNCRTRLQEAILATPCGLTRLMDMLMDREVIRNEALLLLTFLTRDAEEIQKIVVFEGAFEKIFNIIKEEGGSEGGIVVQDCLELLNNLLRNNPTNQILLRETIGLQSVVSLIKLRKGIADGFTQQKTVNLLGALETLALLLAGSSDVEPTKDANRVANQTVFSQNKLLDHLLMLSVESRWAAIVVRCAALRCIGDLILGHAQNRDALGSKLLGDDPDVEPALNSILRIFLRTSSLQECIAAEFVFKCFCEGNPDGQMMLASTITPLPQSSLHVGKIMEDANRVSFGSILVRALISSEGQNDLEASCRAASILSHILKDNVQCKERVLRIQLEVPVSTLSTPEVLMPRIVKYLAVASPISHKQEIHDHTISNKKSMWLQPVLLRLLVTWLADCPDAVNCFLESPAHLTYMIELILSRSSAESVHVAGLAAVLLGECIVFNKATKDNRDAFMVVDAISQRIGLTAYFHIWEEMQNSPLFVSAASASRLPKPLTRSTAAEAVGVSDGQDGEQQFETDKSSTSPVDPLLTSFYDAAFVNFIRHLEPLVREKIVELFSRPKSKVTVIPASLEQKSGESDSDYIIRLKSFMEKQCHEMQELLGRNAALADDLAKTKGDSNSFIKGHNSAMQGTVNGITSRLEADNLRQELQETRNRIETLKAEKTKCEDEISTYKQLAGKYEADLKSLSDAYNSLEQTNYHLELEVKRARGGNESILPDLEAVREEGRQEAQKESEAELNDLLVCLGQEQSKVEKLSSRLTELGEDVDALLENIGDEGEVQGDDEEED